MRRYILERTFQALLTIYIVATLSFVLIRLVPGSPVDQLRAQMLQSDQAMSMDEVNRIVETYTGLNPGAPLWEQYLTYMMSLSQGDLGRSIVFDESVNSILAGAVPWTVFVMSVSLFLIYGLGILLGAFLAYVEGTRLDAIGSSLVTILTSIPYYVAALVMLAVLGFNLGLFPTGGRIASDVTVGLNVPFVRSLVYHATLPVLSMVLTGLGIALSMRANSIQVLGEDYLRVAQLRGLSSNRIVSRYVVPNAVLPMYTGMMISIGFMFGGSVILERIFTYPGVGYYLIEAIDRRDYTLLMGGFLVITIAVVIGIFIADLTYGKIDPRAGNSGKREAYGYRLSSLKLSSLKRLFSRSSGGTAESVADRDFEPGRVGEVPFDVPEIEAESRRDKYSQLFQTWVVVPGKILWSDWRGKVGLLIVAGFVLMGTVGVRLVDTPSPGEHERMAGPFESLAYPLGTDIMGQDLFSIIVHATPSMLEMILAGAVFSTVMATIVGLVSGYVGGAIDRILMMITDVMMTIPGLPLIIVLAAILEPRSPYVVGILLTINAWAGLARSIRSQVLVIREETYVETARIMGVSVSDILTYEVSPNIMPYVLINFMNSARTVIFSSVGLYFLGVFPFSQSNWGVVMNVAQQNNALVVWDRFHWILVPMLTVVTMSYGLILLSQASDQIFNPRLKAKRQEQDEIEEDQQDSIPPSAQTGTM